MSGSTERSELFGRLALGTVQFGLTYGITNTSGKVGPDAVQAILARAAEVGLSTLDTAALYGDSEQSLGSAGVENFAVVTKLPELGRDVADPGLWVRTQMLASLSRLRLPRVDGLLLHRPDVLMTESGPAIWSAMQHLRAEGLVRAIGYSVYEPRELSSLYQAFRPDIVQLPYNALDSRFEVSGWIARLADGGTMVHARSAFLQGLLLAPRDGLPEKFSRWRSVFDAWHQWCSARGLTPLQAALGHSLAHASIDRVLVGVAGMDQFSEILASVSRHPIAAPLDLSSSDIDLINPSRWSSL
ncbi:hypothetical protein VW29_17755 [Devosia limi DSM 17137]|uniref:NADP-dependent oxidoreductase domain-containing protein n=1 Tax=Devosia limi DSM 17137 TaxID=1121477 RepID=A0A0F5LAI6_9HYPH|nr:aldo/keto reductase [Devosia limi]KKB79406.1 hypothetical protein VW29_17755 [Devosia limi DSM 17137]SHF32035.1 hypothetical protein SAMN02745223_02340 [Devosia limi DSM 17137]